MRKSEVDEATEVLRTKLEAVVAERNQLSKKLKTLEPKGEKLAKVKTNLRGLKEQTAALTRENSEMQHSNGELEV